jgi:hypothetical protein
MSQVFKLYNWVGVAFFGLTGIWIALVQPSTYALSLLNLLPFGSALLATKRDSGALARWLSVGINALWAVCLFAAGAMVYFEKRGQSVFAEGISSTSLSFLLLGAIAIPCLLNAMYIGLLLRLRARNDK